MTPPNLPDKQDCLKLIEQYCVPVHIQKHCFAVAGVAVFLAKKLKQKGIDVNIELVQAAGMLHDIVRICDFEQLDYSQFEQVVTEEDKAKLEQIRAKYKGYLHEDAAYEVFKDQYPQLALTIKRHRYTAIADNEHRPTSWEEKLLFYADMRVMHDKVVPLQDRLKDGHLRNAFLRQKREKFAGRCLDTEKIDLLIAKLEQEIAVAAELSLQELNEIPQE